MIMENELYKTRYIYILLLMRSLLPLFVILVICSILGNINLLYFYILFIFIITLFSIRKIIIFKDKIIIKYLFKKVNLDIHSIYKVKYQYAIKGNPVIIIFSSKYKRNFMLKIYEYFYMRFVLYNISEVANVLLIFKNMGISIEIDSSDKIIKQINDEMDRIPNSPPDVSI